LSANGPSLALRIRNQRCGPACSCTAKAASPRKRGDAVGRHLDHQVDAARQHLGDAGVGVGDRTEDHRLERRRAVPVVVVALTTTRGLPPTRLELEGAGAEGLRPKSCAVLLDRRRRDDQAGRIGEVRQERRVGLVEPELTVVLVDGRHLSTAC
jgi:hypothetical protein